MFHKQPGKRRDFHFFKREMRPIFLTIIFTYLLALIPLILIVITTSLTLTNTIYESELDNNLAASRRLARVTDASLGSVRTIAMNLFIDDEVMSLAGQESVKDTALLLSCWHVQKKLTLQKLMNDVIDEIYVHYPYSGTVITTKGLYRDGIFERSCLALTKVSYPDWIKMEEFFGNFQFYLHPLSDGTNGLTLVCRYYAQQDRLQNMSVYLTLNEDCFEAMVKPLKFMDESSVFLMDTAGTNTIFGGPNNTLGADTIQRIIDADNGGTIITDELVITKTASSIVNRWCYLSVSPRAVFEGNFTFKHNFAYAAIGVCILLSILLSLLMAKRQYSPIKQIYQKLAGSNSVHVKNEEKNEYRMIESSIAGLLSNLESSSYQLDQKREQLKSHILMRILLHSSMNEKGLQRLQEDYGISFACKGFIVLAVSLDSLSHSLGDEDDDASRIEHAANRLILTAIEGALSSDFHVGSAMDEDHFACIINADPGNLTGAGFREGLQKAFDYLKNELSFAATITVGSLQTAVTGLSQSYHDAAACMEYAQMTGIGGKVLYYQDMKRIMRIETQNEQNLQHKKNFQYLMSMENYAEARKAILGIIEECEINSAQSPLNWRLYLSYIESLLTFTLGNSRIFSDTDFSLHYLNHLDSLRGSRNSDELIAALKQTFDAIEQWAQMHTAPASAIILDALTYVQQHYSSPDISIGSIADRFNVSISYISRQFKHAYGVGLLDYIHKLRINTAKKLMDDSNMTIKDVAYKVGYINCLTMSRSFKRYEGILPSEYRTIHKGKGK